MVAIITKWWLLALVLFVIAALTDILDGAWARRFGQQSLLGTYLDPIADKFLILAIIYALYNFSSSNIPGLLPMPLWFTSWVFIRELLLIGGILVMTLVGGGVQIRPLSGGKLTTFMQMLCIITFLSHAVCPWVPILIPVSIWHGMLVSTSVTSLFSFFLYGLYALFPSFYKAK